MALNCLICCAVKKLLIHSLTYPKELYHSHLNLDLEDCGSTL